jgi:aspartate/methionine/tyrosine aminotransferase
MTLRFDAPFVQWAATRPPALFDLATSNVLSCRMDDLPGTRDAVELVADEADTRPRLVEAIAARYGVSPERVTTARGASGANFLVAAALLEPGDEVLVERPGYDALLSGPRLLGARIVRFDRSVESAFGLDPDRVRRALTPRTRLIVITSPGNPTGVLANPEALHAIGRLARSNGALVLVDQVFLDAAVALERGTTKVLTAASLDDVFVSTNSLTKSYGLGGLRCGWILSSAEIAGRLQATRNVIDGSMSIVTDRLASLAFSGIDRLMLRSRALLDANRATVRDFLRSREELHWIDGPGTVLFPRIRGVEDASLFADRLLADGQTAVVPGRFFEAPAHFRMGLGGSGDTLRGGLRAIAGALDKREW